MSTGFIACSDIAESLRARSAGSSLEVEHLMRAIRRSSTIQCCQASLQVVLPRRIDGLDCAAAGCLVYKRSGQVRLEEGHVKRVAGLMTRR